MNGYPDFSSSQYEKEIKIVIRAFGRSISKGVTQFVQDGADETGMPKEASQFAIAMAMSKALAGLIVEVEKTYPAFAADMRANAIDFLHAGNLAS